MVAIDDAANALDNWPETVPPKVRGKVKKLVASLRPTLSQLRESRRAGADAAGEVRVMSKIGDLRQALLDLLQEHERDGALPTSARFLYFKTRATLRVEQGAHRRAAAALLLPTRALFPMLS